MKFGNLKVKKHGRKINGWQNYKIEKVEKTKMTKRVKKRDGGFVTVRSHRNTFYLGYNGERFSASKALCLFEKIFPSNSQKIKTAISKGRV